MSNAADRLCEDVLEAAESKPLQKRRQMYLDCAALLSGEKHAKKFLAMAADLDRVIRKHKQLRLNFSGGKKS